MFCTECGATLKPGVRFCNLCGKPVAPASLSPEATPASSPSDALADTVVENVPVSPSAPPAPSPVSPQTPPLSATSPQAETRIQTGVEPAAPAYQPPPPPAPLPPVQRQVVEPSRPPINSGKGNNKGVLLICVAVLGLALGGLAYWLFLRKPLSGVTGGSLGSKITTTAPNKPSALEPTPNNAAAPQSPSQSQDPNATEPKKDDASGASPAAAVPANSSGAPASAPVTASGPSLAGKWHGEYTYNDANEVSKVTLQLSEDNGPERLTGTMTFDPDGNHASSCAMSGVYNPQTKFMLLKIGTCQGNAPDYLQGKIGFSSVELTARQVFGVDPAHNSLLNISRQ
jgi:zinc-ribbon domain